MATVTKDFRLKSGLVVEGSNATVNGSDVITANSIVNGNHSGVVATYDSNSKTIGLSVDVFNLNIDTQGPLTYTNNVLDLTTGYGLQVGTGNDLMLNVSDFADDLAGVGLNFNPNSLALDVDYTEVANIAYVDALTTDDISEGSTNLYYSDARARAALSAGDGINYSNGLISVSAATLGGITVGNGSVEIERNIVDGWYDANGAAATAEQNANDYTDSAIAAIPPVDFTGYATETYVNTAIDNLVDGAPALLDTLNEIAAAINDDANYATTLTTALAGKQATLLPGAAISSADLANNIVSVLYADGLDRDGNGKLIVSAGWGITSNASGVYLDTSRFGTGLSVGPTTIDIDDTVVVTHTDLDGYLNSNNGTTYVALTDYADALVAAGDPTATPTYEAIDVNSIAKHVASTVSANGTTTAYSFDHAEYRTAKFLVKVSQGSHTEVSEVLLTLDTSDNIAMTEYAVVGTNGSLSTITADKGAGSLIDLKVTTTFLSTVNVVGTLIA